MRQGLLSSENVCCYSYKISQLAHVTWNKSSEQSFCHKDWENVVVIYVKPRSSQVRKSPMKLSDIYLLLRKKSHTSYTTCQWNSKQNQTVIIKITKRKNNINAYLHRVNLRSCFRYISHYVFTTGNHHLGFFLGIVIFSSQQPKWWLYIMKTLNFISHGKCKQKGKSKENWTLGKLRLFIYVLHRAHEIFESGERKFVGRWRSIYTNEN